MKLIKISALWCPACLIMNNRINKILNNYDIEVIDYDYDIDCEEIKKYNVGSILPVMIFIRDDIEVKRLVGEISEKKLVKELSDIYEKN